MPAAGQFGRQSTGTRAQCVLAGMCMYRGTTAVESHGKVVGKGDAFEQARHIFTIIAEALQELGSSLTDVVRTRMYVVDILTNGDRVGQAHGEVFRDIRPAATMVEVSGLIAPDLLVEIEVDAILP